MICSDVRKTAEFYLGVTWAPLFLHYMFFVVSHLKCFNVNKVA